jgi:hypothetical protein
VAEGDRPVPVFTHHEHIAEWKPIHKVTTKNVFYVRQC